MNGEMLDHYLKGGYFTAIFQPEVESDLTDGVDKYIGRNVVVFRNMEVLPILGGKYKGNRRLSIEGAFTSNIPECDFVNMKIIDKFLPKNSTIYECKHIYKIVVRRRGSAKKCFGNEGDSIKLPVICYRDYCKSNRRFVKSLFKDSDELWYKKYGDKKFVNIYKKEIKK